MEKFKSTHRTLEVISYTHSLLLHLNRQIITLLSVADVSDVVLLELQERHLTGLVKGLTEPKESLKWLGAHVPASLIDKSSPDLPFTDPFTRALLQSIYSQQIRDLRRKAWLHVPEGRLLMGVTDETGTLKYGEVFFQFATTMLDDNSTCSQGACFPICCSPHPYKLPTKMDVRTFEQLEDGQQVMVWKNPCLYPGDVRVLTYRKISALSHMVDCIVFPSQGEVPHTYECSGSDLDGDLYSVCWAEELFPPTEKRNLSPLAYDTVPAKELERQVTVEDLMDMMTNVIDNNTLGVIAQAWLAFADFQVGRAWSSQMSVSSKIACGSSGLSQVRTEC